MKYVFGILFFVVAVNGSAVEAKDYDWRFLSSSLAIDDIYIAPSSLRKVKQQGEDLRSILTLRQRNEKQKQRAKSSAKIFEGCADCEISYNATEWERSTLVNYLFNCTRKHVAEIQEAEYTKPWAEGERVNYTENQPEWMDARLFDALIPKLYRYVCG
jgi:hypothetical protein